MASLKVLILYIQVRTPSRKEDFHQKPRGRAEQTGCGDGYAVSNGNLESLPTKIDFDDVLGETTMENPTQ